MVAKHSQSGRHKPFSILSISYDPNLLMTRQLLLEHLGYKVISAEGFVTALKSCSQDNFDLAVMGHSIPHPDKQALLDAINRNCAAPVIALTRLNEPLLDGVAASVDPQDPKEFIAAVERLLSGKQHTGT